MHDQIKQISAWLGTGSINIFGCPFAGKDTQGRKLAELFGAALIGSGQILRSHHDPEKVRHILETGGLVPRDFYFDLILPHLSEPRLKNKPLILDSVGRAHGEEETIMKAAQQSGHPLKVVVSLQLNEAEVWRRFEAAKQEKDRGKRKDDNPDVLKNRLEKFNRRTVPVIDFYRKKGLLVQVDGSLARDQVTAEIIKALAAFAKA